MPGKLSVGVIFGGRSGEHEISLLSASTVIGALDPAKYDVVAIGIAKDGRWLLSGDPMRTLREAANADQQPLLPERPAGRSLILPPEEARLRPFDVLIPMVHGPFGEDGCLQGMLEMAHVPYVGAGVLGSALGMDKAVMKDVLRQNRIPVVETLMVRRKTWRARPEQIIGAVENGIGYPCFIKPANLGSSVGISKARNAAELRAGLDEAAQYDRKLVVERAVPNVREIEVSVLGNDDPIASVPGEIVPCHEFYDYSAKYLEDGTRLIIPAGLPAETTHELRRLAVAAFVALDCAGMARVDFFLDGQSGETFVNELNTIPGFTRGSMYPKLWEATGIAIGELLDRLIMLAIERFEDKASSRTSYQ